MIINLFNIMHLNYYHIFNLFSSFLRLKVFTLQIAILRTTINYFIHYFSSKKILFLSRYITYMISFFYSLIPLAVLTKYFLLLKKHVYSFVLSLSQKGVLHLGHNRTSVLRGIHSCPHLRHLSFFILISI